MTDSLTVLDRLLAAGISEDRARAWLTTGVLVDGVTVTDPEAPAAPPARVVLPPV
ncbi:hypothetical protein [Actinomycetospora aeridis]|uniref:Uncharacterized protein n=1 Tax=Actinomycetospora aeridis TaxID=3129231 RepID=A0ABU8N159_9PSEU